MKKRKIGKLWYLFLIMVCVLSGCGEAAGSGGTGHSYYEAKEIDLGRPYIIRYSNGYLYYAKGGNIWRRSIDEAGEGLGEEPAKVVYRGESDGSLMDFVVDDGGIYCFLIQTKVTLKESFQTEVTGGALVKVGFDGRKEYELPVEDVGGVLTGNSQKRYLAVDGKSRLFLFLGNTIYVAEGGDGFRCMLDVSAGGSDGKEQEGQIWEGGGKIYCRIDRPGSHVAYEVSEEGGDFRLKRMSGDGWDQLDVKDDFFGSSWGLLCSGPDRVLRQYSETDACWRDVLNWSDSNVGGYLEEVVQVSEEGFLASFFVVAEHETKTYLLNGKPADEAPEREELVLACYERVDQYLDEQVVAFNQASDKYHVSIKVYQGEEGLIRLDADLVSSDPPDLVDLSWLDAEKYGKQLVMEDLTPYLDASPVLDKADYLEAMVDAYTLNGRLVCIPSRVCLYTVMGRVSHFGEEAGWDMEDVMTLAERYPDYSMFGRHGFAFQLDFCYGDYIVGRFVDWDSGECGFESQEFCELIKWIKEHSYGTGYEVDYGEEGWADRLAVRVTADSPGWFALELEKLEEEAMIVGYPSADGRALHLTQVFDAVGITSKSRQKEGAWAFLEYFLSEMNCLDTISFPTNKDRLDQMVEEAARYSEEHSEFQALPQKLKEQILEAVTSADFNYSARNARRDRVLLIIQEEMEGYLKGYKSLEKTAAVIQNRVELLVQEER